MSELPPLTFGHAGHALAWAEEAASLTDVQSPTLLVIRRLQQIPGKGMSEWGRDDYRNLAYTILSCAAQIPDGLALAALREVYGAAEQERGDMLATEIARVLVREYPAKGYSVLKRIAGYTVPRERSRRSHRRTLPFGHYATVIGVQRQSLDDGDWRPIIRRSEGILCELVERAAVDLTDRLKTIGVM